MTGFSFFAELTLYWQPPRLFCLNLLFNHVQCLWLIWVPEFGLQEVLVWPWCLDWSILQLSKFVLFYLFCFNQNLLCWQKNIPNFTPLVHWYLYGFVYSSHWNHWEDIKNYKIKLKIYKVRSLRECQRSFRLRLYVLPLLKLRLQATVLKKGFQLFESVTNLWILLPLWNSSSFWGSKSEMLQI